MVELKELELKALYFDHDALIEPNYKLFRLDLANGRYYYTQIEDKYKFVPSVTTVIDKTSAMSPYLLQWILKHGRVKASELARRAADYGTMLHYACAEFLILKSFKLEKDDILLYMEKHIEKLKLPYNAKDWTIYQGDDEVYVKDIFQNDIKSFHLFCQDYKVKPIAIEVGLISRRGYAGTIDIVCEMTITEERDMGEKFKSGKNEGKVKLTKVSRKIIAVIDIKSGRHQFYEANEIQIAGFYLPMWNENFPVKPASHAFNWAPKDISNKESKYLLKDQTKSSDWEEAELHLKKYMLRNYKMPEAIGVISGEIKFGEDSNNYTEIGFEEFLKTQGRLPETKHELSSEDI